MTQGATTPLQRPACFDFFLTGQAPDITELRNYVEQLEARATQPAEGGEALDDADPLMALDECAKLLETRRLMGDGVRCEVVAKNARAAMRRLTAPPASQTADAPTKALLTEARAALAGGLWDYGPGQDEHAACTALVERIDAHLSGYDAPASQEQADHSEAIKQLKMAAGQFENAASIPSALGAVQYAQTAKQLRASIALLEASQEQAERIASAWEAVHGYDKHGVAAWTRKRARQEQAQQPDHVPDAGKMIQQPSGFPSRIMELLRTVADRNPGPGKSPWEDAQGEPMQDDADAAIAWIMARSQQPSGDNLNCKSVQKRLAVQQPSGGEVVTLESALEAIEYVAMHNGPGRSTYAKGLLKAATPKPEPMTGADNTTND